MPMAVATRTPASAASGIAPTHCDASRTTASRTSDWVTAASRERAPDRTLTAVRAIAAVAGMPPNMGVTMFATPCPSNSRSESWRSPTLMPSATVADMRLSSAARAATATAGRSRLPKRATSTVGSEGAGRPTGIAPMVATSRLATATTTVATMTAGSETGKPGRMRAAISMVPATKPATAIGSGSGAASQAVTAARVPAAPDSPLVSMPRIAGTCWSAMTTAMPTVNPSTTGSGM